MNSVNVFLYIFIGMMTVQGSFEKKIWEFLRPRCFTKEDIFIDFFFFSVRLPRTNQNPFKKYLRKAWEKYVESAG